MQKHNTVLVFQKFLSEFVLFLHVKLKDNKYGTVGLDTKSPIFDLLILAVTKILSVELPKGQLISKANFLVLI